MLNGLFPIHVSAIAMLKWWSGAVSIPVPCVVLLCVCLAACHSLLSIDPQCFVKWGSLQIFLTHGVELRLSVRWVPLAMVLRRRCGCRRCWKKKKRPAQYVGEFCSVELKYCAVHQNLFFFVSILGRKNAHVLEVHCCVDRVCKKIGTSRWCLEAKIGHEVRN